MLIDDAKERTKLLRSGIFFLNLLLVQSANRISMDGSLGKLLERYDGSLRDHRAFFLRHSDFLQVVQLNYAKYYSTKRKSVKNASDSSVKLISYSSIFASHFWIFVALLAMARHPARVLCGSEQCNEDPKNVMQRSANTK